MQPNPQVPIPTSPGLKREVHPSIAYETSLIDESVALAKQAAEAITSGSMKAAECNVLLSAGRMYQGASRQNITNRLSAGRLAMQEAKLIEQQQEAAQAAAT